MRVILSTINARYIHTSLGLRYLYANLNQYQAEAILCEYTLEQRESDIVEHLLQQNPTIICLGVYIWNISQSEEVVRIIKSIRPEIIVIIGGPEVSHEHHLNPINTLADYVICGWGEASLPRLLTDLEENRKPVDKIIQGIKLPLAEIKFPYDYYSDEDIAYRIIYVEASRGCPFKCEFCLSSLDEGIFSFDLELFLAELEKLFFRGVRQFKFVDRTFNLKIENSQKILQFFLDKIQRYPSENIFAHFELVPDYLPDELKRIIQAFPKGALQFEIGIQTLNRDVQRNISRRTHLDKAKKNIHWLSNQTGVHLHVDLIAGLPGEDLTSFSQGVNQLWQWQPQEIQLGILKRLKGTPITRHTKTFDYIYDEQPPFTVLQNQHLDFVQLQQINRLARYWDLVVNSGRFPHTVPLILNAFPFENMWAFSEWLFNKTKQTYKISLDRLLKLIFDWLIEQNVYSAQQIITALRTDFMSMRIQGWPHYLGSPPPEWTVRIPPKNSRANKRQQRHMTD